MTSVHTWDTSGTVSFREYERRARIWWAAWERAHPPAPLSRERKPCIYCGAAIRQCGCAAHRPPMWHHWPSNHMRCGPAGTGRTLATPDSDFWRAS